MNLESIVFPHLGIILKHVPRSFRIFGFEIMLYGVVIAAAALAGVYLVLFLAERTGQDADSYLNFALLAVVLGILGARLYYVAFSWDYYSRHPLEILDFRGGGLGIYGGVLAGMAVGLWYAKRKKIPLMRLFDTGIVGVSLGQCIGRWGNFFNREAFGEYTDGLFAMRLPLKAVYESDVTSRMMEHAVSQEDLTWIQVHPTFLYESVLNFCLTSIMVLILLRLKNRKEGLVFHIYLLGYGTGRFLIELLRTDQLLLWGTRIPVSCIVAAVMAVLGAVWMLRSMVFHPAAVKKPEE